MPALDSLPALPRVAVCVPAYKETDDLAGTLAGLQASSYPAELLQVVVAVDGGHGPTVAVAEAGGAHVVVLAENRGSYAARNAAVAAVERPVDVLLFTDAGCVVPPSWVAAHVEALRAAHSSGGAVRFTFAGSSPSPAEFIDSVRHLQQEAYVSRDGFAVTCNLGVRAEVYDALGFDASLRTGGDADFGRRARDAGYSLTYAPDAWVEHAARRTPAELMQKVRRIAGGVEGQRARWEARSRPVPARIARGPWMRARAQGYEVSWLWGAKAALLNYWATRTINVAVNRMLDSAPPGTDR